MNGGVDRVCRGADPDDNNPIYFEVFDVDDLEACKELCAGTSDCVGVESIGRTVLGQVICSNVIKKNTKKKRDGVFMSTIVYSYFVINYYIK